MVVSKKTSQRVALGLLAGAYALVFASLAVNLGRGVLFITPERFELYQMFDLGQENNIPAWFSAALLLLAAYLFATIALGVRQADRRASNMWAGLAGIFVYLSLDEAARLHERTGPIVRSALGLFGLESRDYFNYASWVVLGALAVLAVVVVYARFFLGLPRETRNLFILAGTFYCAGALGLELAGALWASYSLTGSANLTYLTLQTLEEAAEMIGAIVLVYALLEYLRLHVPGE